jgi:trehalose utilization protein
MKNGIRVTVWNEGVHDKKNPKVREVYPKGMGWQIAQALKKQPGLGTVRVSELDDPGQGLTEKILKNTDVMTWWGHTAHDRVQDKLVDLVHQRVLDGMGLVVLHSGHYSKIFKRLMGTTCSLKWREWKGIGEKERLWVVDPAHPVAEGLPEYFELPRTEMYGEPFDIPQPDQLVLLSWFQGGEVFRSGCCWHRGKGKIFYFRPGHETFPIYHDPTVMKVIYNGIRWAAPTFVKGPIRRVRSEPLERMD